MAVLGSCVSDMQKRGNVLALKWTLTCDDSGDADGDTRVLGPDFFLGPVTGTVIGVEIEWTDAAAGYDLYIRDHLDIDILKGLGVGLAAAANDAANRFCPVNEGQELVAQTQLGFYPIYLHNVILEAIGDDMGNAQISAITLYIRVPDFEDWR